MASLHTKSIFSSLERSNLAKLEASCTVILSPMVSLLWTISVVSQLFYLILSLLFGLLKAPSIGNWKQWRSVISSLKLWHKKRIVSVSRNVVPFPGMEVAESTLKIIFYTFSGSKKSCWNQFIFRHRCDRFIPLSYPIPTFFSSLAKTFQIILASNWGLTQISHLRR